MLDSLSPDVNPFPRIHRPFRRPATGPLSRDRRTEKRCAAARVFCQVIQPAPTGKADLLDLSPRGACLALTVPVEKGAVLHLRLSNRAHLCIHEVMLRVAHSRLGLSGLTLVGGPFVNDLPPEVFRTLMT